jgi:hypothetical protein
MREGYEGEGEGEGEGVGGTPKPGEEGQRRRP